MATQTPPRPEKHVWDHKRRVHAAEAKAEGITDREKELLDIIADIEEKITNPTSK